MMPPVSHIGDRENLTQVFQLLLGPAVRQFNRPKWTI